MDGAGAGVAELLAHRGERPAGPADVVDQQHRAVGHGVGDGEGVVGVVVLEEAVGQLGLGAGLRARSLDDRWASSAICAGSAP